MFKSNYSILETHQSCIIFEEPFSINYKYILLVKLHSGKNWLIGIRSIYINHEFIYQELTFAIIIDVNQLKQVLQNYD